MEKKAEEKELEIYVIEKKQKLEKEKKKLRKLRELEAEIMEAHRLVFEDHDIAARNIEGKTNKEID